MPTYSPFATILLVAFLLIGRPSTAAAVDFTLLGSYPANGQTVGTSGLFDNAIYLKFNNPVDRTLEGLIMLHDKSGYDICQLDICGLVEYAENGTEIIWHPLPQYSATLFQPGKYLTIRIGDPDPSPCPHPPCPPVLLRDTSGNAMPVTYIDFNIDSCQPTASLQLTGNNTVVVCPHCINMCADDSYVTGDTIKLTVGITNPACGPNVEVEGKVWVDLPGGPLSLYDPHATRRLSPGESFSVDLVTHTFSGNEPPGQYIVNFRIMNAVTGDYYSKASGSFNFVPKKCQ
jgi:hypothetical protein